MYHLFFIFVTVLLIGLLIYNNYLLLSSNNYRDNSLLIFIFTLFLILICMDMLLFKKNHYEMFTKEQDLSEVIHPAFFKI